MSLYLPDIDVANNLSLSKKTEQSLREIAKLKPYSTLKRHDIVEDRYRLRPKESRHVEDFYITNVIK